MSEFSKEDLISYGYSQEFADKVFELPDDNELYIAVDMQGGTFGMYRCYNKRDWLCQACDWAFGDGLEEPPVYPEDDILGVIADVWDLMFIKVNPDNPPKTKKNYDEIYFKRRALES